MSFFGGEFFGGEFKQHYYHHGSGYVGTFFFGGAFFDGGFFSQQGKTGTGGIDPKRNIVKPTGLLHLPKKKKEQKAVDRRVEETRKIHREVIAEAAHIGEPAQFKAIRKMSMAEIEAEIGELLRKTQRTRDEEDMLVFLMIAASV